MTGATASGAAGQRGGLAPSLLRVELLGLEETVVAVAASADRLHLDVCDGQFCPTLTFGPDLVRAVARVVDVPINLHLGMLAPDRHIEAFVEAGATWLTIHPSTVADPMVSVRSIRAAGGRPGLAVLPDEDPDSHRDLYGEVDVVVSLNVWPGIQAQTPVVDPVARTRQVVRSVRATQSEASIEVDGGVSLELVGPLVAAGADVLAVGSRIFGARDPARAAAEFRAALELSVDVG